MSKITSITASKILDSRSEWTLSTKVLLADGTTGVGEVPSGISTGRREATLLPVEEAQSNVNQTISAALKGLKPDNQIEIDQTLVELDGTANKSNLGANAILSVSLAVCDAAARFNNQPLYEYIHHAYNNTPYPFPPTHYPLPIPMMLLLEGGKHADNKLDFQEFMIIPCDRCEFTEALLFGDRIYDFLAATLKQQSYSTAVGVEGGFSPEGIDTPTAFELIDMVINDAGAGEAKIAIDVAASSFTHANTYKLEGLGRTLTAEDLLTFYQDQIAAHPRIFSLEDPFSENHEGYWKKIKDALKGKVEIIGDDILVTNKERLALALKKNLITGAIIKPNQIGTLTETIEFATLAKNSGLKTIVSHRGGETNSSFISDLAVAISADFIKTGAPARGERVAKYNRLLEIERELKHNHQ